MVEQKYYFKESQELTEKHKSLIFSNRKRFTILEGNPFGYRAGIHFTGNGLNAAVSRTVVEFGILFNKHNEDLMKRIKTIVKAILAQTVVPGLQNGEKSKICTTAYDVNSTKSIHLFSNFFYEKETDRIFCWVNEKEKAQLDNIFNLQDNKKIATAIWHSMNKYSLIAFIQPSVKNGQISYRVTRHSGDIGTPYNETFTEFIAHWKDVAMKVVVDAWKRDNPYSMESFSSLNVDKLMIELINKEKDIDITKPAPKELKA